MVGFYFPNKPPKRPPRPPFFLAPPSTIPATSSIALPSPSASNIFSKKRVLKIGFVYVPPPIHDRFKWLGLILID